MQERASSIYRKLAADAASVTALRNRRLFEWWQVRAGARAMPQRNELEPTELAWALGHFSLIEIGADGQFTYRVDGTHIAALTGIDMTGKRADLYPRARSRQLILDSYRELAATGRPLCIYMDTELDGRWVNLEILLLPLADAAGRVSHLMSAMAAKADLPRR
jgi:hypothetical protein